MNGPLCIGGIGIDMGLGTCEAGIVLGDGSSSSSSTSAEADAAAARAAAASDTGVLLLVKELYALSSSRVVADREREGAIDCGKGVGGIVSPMAAPPARPGCDIVTGNRAWGAMRL